MSSGVEKIEDTDLAWEPGGLLGHDERYVRRAPDEVSAEVDEALGLKSISIRLQRDLLVELKAIAKSKGIGYQPLIRQVLTEYAAANGIRKLPASAPEKVDQN